MKEKTKTEKHEEAKTEKYAESFELITKISPNKYEHIFKTKPAIDVFRPKHKILGTPISSSKIELIAECPTFETPGELSVKLNDAQYFHLNTKEYNPRNLKKQFEKLSKGIESACKSKDGLYLPRAKRNN